MSDGYAVQMGRIDVCIFAMDGIKRYSGEVVAKVVASYCISLSTQPLVLYNFHTALQPKNCY